MLVRAEARRKLNGLLPVAALLAFAFYYFFRSINVPCKEQVLPVQSSCAHTSVYLNEAHADRCAEYEAMQLNIPDCTGKPNIIPRILHIAGKDAVTHTTTSYSLANPEFRLNALDNEGAGNYVRMWCGEDAAKAYNCLNAAAFRGDLFRYCAHYAEGGIYLDQDILPLKPLDEMFSTCSIVTLGHDYPMNGRPAKQTKMMSAAPGTSLMKCAVNLIVSNVRKRAYPESPLAISATLAMQRCYEQYPDDVAITYIDTREAIWPFTGLRAGNTILAFEQPSAKHFKEDRMDYPALTERREIYADACEL